MRTPRILCLRLPDWPIQRLLTDRPELAARPVVLTERQKRGEFVRYCNPVAQQRGIRAGMPLAEARSVVGPPRRRAGKKSRNNDLLLELPSESHSELHSELHSETVQPALDRQALQDLALACERFSFCVGLEEAERPECLLLDITGVAHFFGGEQALAEELARSLNGQIAVRREPLVTGPWDSLPACHPSLERQAGSLSHVSLPFDVRLAIGDTVGAAWAAVHFLAGPGQPAVLPVGEQTVLESLPVSGLRLPDATLKKLARLGLRTVGQLLALDRAAVTRRFGDDLLRRLDQLGVRRGLPESTPSLWSGPEPRSTELITPCRPRPRYAVEQQLETGLTQPEAIEALLFRLLRQLLELLRPLSLGTREVACSLRQENRQTQSFHLRLCETTCDLRHLSDLLRLRLERLRLAAPLTDVVLEALEVTPLETFQQEFFATESRDQARQFSRLLNRLSSRLGDDAVLTPQLLPDPIPERAVLWQPACDSSSDHKANSLPTRFRATDRPPTIFPQPRPIDVIIAPDGRLSQLRWRQTEFDVACHWGPERIESGWWQDEYVRRDYYRVETATGQWLWVFRRLQDDCWFWHGTWF